MIINNNALTTVKSTELFVTEFVGATLDPTLTKGSLDSAPSIYKNGVTFFLDYSSTSNGSDLKLLKRFFSKVNIGNTFSITGGVYYDERNQTKYSFGGIYELVGSTGTYNQFLNLKGISYSSSLYDGTYKNYNFTNSLNFISNKGSTAQFLISKFNTDNPYNFSFFGIYGNDLSSEEYIEVIGASLNPNRYKIDNCIKCNDGSEIILINPSESILNENMYFNKRTINLLMRRVPNLNTLSQSKYQNGIIKKINEDQKTLDVLSDQNLYQRYSRAKTDPNNYYDWYPINNTENFKNILNPYMYDKLSISVDYFSYVKIGSSTQRVFTNTSTASVPTITTTTVLYVDNVITSTKIYKSSSTSTIPNLKIDLSDSSLFGWKIMPFYDEECSIPLTEYFYLLGVPGFDGASFIFLSSVNNPPSFYLKFENNIVLKLMVTI